MALGEGNTTSSCKLKNAYKLVVNSVFILSQLCCKCNLNSTLLIRLSHFFNYHILLSFRVKSRRMHICSDSIKFSVLIAIEHCSIATLFVGCFKNARKRKTRVQTTVLFEHSFRQEYQAKNALVQVNKK